MAHRALGSALAVVVLLTATGCSDPGPESGDDPASAPAASPAPSPPPAIERQELPRDPLETSLDGDLASVTAELGRLGYVRTATVVAATDTLPGSLAAAVALARAVSAPLVVGELDDARRLAADLGAERVVTVGATEPVAPAPSRVASPSASAAPAPAPAPAPHPTGPAPAIELETVVVSGRDAATRERLADAGDVDAAQLDLPSVTTLAELRTALTRAVAADAPVALVDGLGLDPAGVAAAAAAVGVRTLDVAGLSLLDDRDATEALADLGRMPALTVAAAPVADDVLDATRWVAEAAVAGRRILPDLGWRLLPDVRLVGLYGHPQTTGLGVLGEQPVDAAIERAKEQAAAYDDFSVRPVVPLFEIIATVASGEAGPDGDRSRETELEILEPWVDAAEEAGVYVVLDLQPGLTTFLEQAKEYESLLRRPHVGLALDPEWRLDPCPPKCEHLRSIGSVGADEVNEVSGWLAELVVEHALPQKLFLVHQFKLSMIRERGRIRTDIPQLAVTIQMDGQGPQGTKLDTWRTLHAQPDADRYFWGWKNFHDEDSPTRSPADTMALEPKPVLVTYQ